MRDPELAHELEDVAAEARPRRQSGGPGRGCRCRRTGRGARRSSRRCVVGPGATGRQGRGSAGGVRHGGARRGRCRGGRFETRVGRAVRGARSGASLQAPEGQPALPVPLQGEEGQDQRGDRHRTAPVTMRFHTCSPPAPAFDSACQLFRPDGDRQQVAGPAPSPGAGRSCSRSNDGARAAARSRSPVAAAAARPGRTAAARPRRQLEPRPAARPGPRPGCRPG